MSGDIFYIWLSSACGEGSPLGGELLKTYGNAENIYNLSEKELKYLQESGVKSEHIRRLSDKNLDNAERTVNFCLKNNVTVINCNSEVYPSRLRNIRSFPIILYCKGKIADIDNELCIAMVGTREMTDYGKFTAYNMASELTMRGAVIVSGMAKGIDGASHKGCLIAKGYTIAVLGCGIERAYPPENKALMERICEKGLVVTEYPPFSEPKGSHFPVRNRIISGLSQAVIVVEADKKSGALITAKTALFQGKEIYAVPGNINSFTSTGTNELIKNGANIITCADDILKDYEYLYSEKLRNRDKTPAVSPVISRRERETVRIAERKAKKDKDAESGGALRTFKSSIVQKQSVSPVSDSKGTVTANTEEKPLTPEQKLLAIEIILDESEAEIFKKILAAYTEKNSPVYPESLLSENFNISDIMNLLSVLEIYGIIISVAGGAYTISDLYLSA